jgi:hypothetical protein
MSETLPRPAERAELAPMRSIAPLLLPSEVAALLRVPLKRVYELPITKRKIGRSVRYRPADVEKYLDRCDEHRVRRNG